MDINVLSAVDDVKVFVVYMNYCVYIELKLSVRQIKTFVCFYKRIHSSESPYGVLDAGVQ